MRRIFFEPSKYVQEAGAINTIGKYAETLRKKALLVGGKTALSTCEETIQNCLHEKNLACHLELFNGEEKN